MIPGNTRSIKYRQEGSWYRGTISFNNPRNPVFFTIKMGWRSMAIIIPIFLWILRECSLSMSQGVFLNNDWWSVSWLVVLVDEADGDELAELADIGKESLELISVFFSFSCSRIYWSN